MNVLAGSFAFAAGRECPRSRRHILSDVFAPAQSVETKKQQRVWPLFWLSAVVHWPFFVLAFVYAVTTFVLLSSVPQYQQASTDALILAFLTFSLPAGLLAIFVFRLLQYAFFLKPESPSRQMISDIADLWRKPQWLIVGLPMLVAMTVFNKGMVELKPMIPVLNPFSWDRTFMEMDRALHFGFDPWVLLQPIMGHDMISFAVNVLYNFWFLALFGTFMWFGFATRANAVRTQFFVSYMLTWWIGGGLMALYFSSAGPVYYSNLGLSPDPYVSLMDYLRDLNTRLPILSLQTQQMLWDGYLGKSQAIGISAFPSMHNASSLLFALAAWQMSRKAGIAFAVYCVVIFFGSIHVGWHYAVDGYAGWAIALVSWWLAGLFTRWHGRQKSTLRLNDGLAAL
jgi:hypothetical protein